MWGSESPVVQVLKRPGVQLPRDWRRLEGPVAQRFQGPGCQEGLGFQVSRRFRGTDIPDRSRGSRSLGSKEIPKDPAFRCPGAQKTRGLEGLGTQRFQVAQGIKTHRRSRVPDGPGDPRNLWMPIYHNPRQTNYTPDLLSR